MRLVRRTSVVVALGVTQTVAWASSYYLPAVLATPMLLFFGAPLASVFVILHGAGNGILTIAKGTLPLVIFGAQGYGARQGILMVPARITQALAPWLSGL